MSFRFGPLQAAIALAAGIAIAPVLDRLGVPVTARWALAAACLAVVRRHPALLVAAVVCAGAAHGAAQRPRPPAGVTVDDREVDRIAGVVDGPVVRTVRGSAARIDGVWVWADELLVPGERVAVTGHVLTGRGREPFELSAQHIEHVADDPGIAARAWRWAASVQAAGAARIEDAGGDPSSRAALRGIVLGDRSAVPPVLDDRWRAVGIYHVLSVSGLHLAVVAGLVFSLLRKLIAASPWGGRVRPAVWAAPPSLVFAIGYTLVTGAQLATVRALLVIALVMLGIVLDRPLRLLDALGAAAIVVLVWNPADLLDPAFQLSFVAALTLAIRPPAARSGSKIIGWLVRGVTTSLWIAITTAPITAFHFQQVAAGGVVGNLVLTPLVELLALPLALAGLVLGPLGTPLVRAATALVELVDGAAGWLAHVTPVGHVAVAGTAAMCALVVLSVWCASRPRPSLIGWTALAVMWTLARTPPPPGALRVTFVDVGQGDAAILELPDGAVWLVDAGGNASARARTAAIAPGVTISRALAAAGHDRIDLAVLSHPHPDHYLGFGGIDVPIAELWSADEVDPVPAGDFAAIAAGLAVRGTRLAHPPLGLAREQAGVTLEVLAPRYVVRDGAPPIEAADPVRSVNDNSLVLVIRYRGVTLLFAGDVEREGEDAIVAAGVPRADVVKVPHHGSPTSSSAAFIAATHPSLAVISCGRGNAFGFPSADVVARWRAAGATVARTDTGGSVTVVVDAAGGLAVP